MPDYLCTRLGKLIFYLVLNKLNQPHYLEGSPARKDSQSFVPDWPQCFLSCALSISWTFLRWLLVEEARKQVKRGNTSQAEQGMKSQD